LTSFKNEENPIRTTSTTSIDLHLTLVFFDVHKKPPNCLADKQSSNRSNYNAISVVIPAEASRARDVDCPATKTKKICSEQLRQQTACMFNVHNPPNCLAINKIQIFSITMQ